MSRPLVTNTRLSHKTNKLTAWTDGCVLCYVQWARINSFIERAILDADKDGVKVFGLGALNKNEALNGGGALFVEKHPNLKVRVVHGNTLTAAAVLQKIPAVSADARMSIAQYTGLLCLSEES